jgi:YbgC/YbaW family acyl-CoA thioester hydrolase
MKYGSNSIFNFITNYEDIDCGGGVHNPNYLKYFERARNFHLKEIGFSQPTLISKKLAFVISESQLKFIKPALLEENLKIYTTITKANNLSILVEQVIVRSECNLDKISFAELIKSREPGLICASAARMIFFNLEKFKPARMPIELMQAMAIPEDFEALGISNNCLF